MKIYVLVLTLLFSISANSACNLPKKALFFSNGMFNDKTGAIQSLTALRKAISKNHPEDNFVKWKIAFNTNEDALLQFQQVFRQKIKDTGISMWRNFAKLLEVDPQYISEFSNFYLADQYISDIDLKTQETEYRQTLESGLNIVVVAHSQGNFYANFSLEKLNRHTDTILISVATPASYVYNDGRYITFDSDRAISIIPGALPANATREHPGLFDHEFIKHYLNDKETNIGITEYIHSALMAQTTDLPLDTSSGYLNEDLVKTIKYYNSLFTKKDLAKGECLLSWQLFSIYGLHGLTCEQRNFKEMKLSLIDCLRDLKDADHDSTRCAFYRGMDFANPYRQYFPDTSLEFFNKFPNCDVTYKQFKEELGESEVLTAIKILESLK
jgi:hypothetical protein